MIAIQDFLKTVKTGSVARENIPMGLGMGFPVLGIVGDRLLVSVFYYRSVLRPEDKTLLFPPEYLLTLDYPSGKLVSFENIKLDPRFSKVPFGKPVGHFRHEAIKYLDRRAYKAKREELYLVLDRLIASLGEEGEFSQADEARLAELYTMLIEPSLRPFYKFLSPQFFDRYIHS